MHRFRTHQLLLIKSLISRTSHLEQMSHRLIASAKLIGTALFLTSALVSGIEIPLSRRDIISRSICRYLSYLFPFPTNLTQGVGEVTGFTTKTPLSVRFSTFNFHQISASHPLNTLAISYPIFLACLLMTINSRPLISMEYKVQAGVTSILGRFCSMVVYIL